MESPLDLGWAFPALQDTIDMKRPQSVVTYMAMKGPCWLGLARASSLYKDYTMTTASRWPSTRLERSSGWRSEIRHSLLWEKPRRTGLQTVRCFQVKVLWAQILASSCPREMPTSRTKVWSGFSCSPWAAFLLLFIFEPCSFNLFVKLVSSRIQQIPKW